MSTTYRQADPPGSPSASGATTPVPTPMVQLAPAAFACVAVADQPVAVPLPEIITPADPVVGNVKVA